MLRPQDGAVITQFDYPQCETLGLLKMDFLGLRNLTVIDDALENITRNGKEAPDLERLPLDDPLTYAMLSRGSRPGGGRPAARGRARVGRADGQGRSEAHGAQRTRD